MDYEELSKLYSEYFSLYYLGEDFTTKVALISLICYLTEKLRKKKSTITYSQVIKSIDHSLPEKFVNGLAVVCSDFAYGCKSFPTFGIEDKQIPEKIKEILGKQLPF